MKASNLQLVLVLGRTIDLVNLEIQHMMLSCRQKMVDTICISFISRLHFTPLLFNFLFSLSLMVLALASSSATNDEAREDDGSSLQDEKLQISGEKV